MGLLHSGQGARKAGGHIRPRLLRVSESNSLRPCSTRESTQSTSDDDLSRGESLFSQGDGAAEGQEDRPEGCVSFINCNVKHLRGTEMQNIRGSNYLRRYQNSVNSIQTCLVLSSPMPYLGRRRKDVLTRKPEGRMFVR